MVRRMWMALACGLVIWGFVLPAAWAGVDPGELYQAIYAYNKTHQTRMDPVDVNTLLQEGFLSVIPEVSEECRVSYVDVPPEGKQMKVAIVVYANPPIIREAIFPGWGFEGEIATPPAKAPASGSANFPGSLGGVMEYVTRVPEKQMVPATSPTPIGRSNQQEVGQGTIRVSLPSKDTVEIRYYFPILPRIQSWTSSREKAPLPQRSDRFSKEVLPTLLQTRPLK